MAFDFFNFKEKSYLGIDIGTTSIKVAEMRAGGRGPELVNYTLFETYSHLERLNTALQTSTLKLYDREVAEYLKLIISRAGFRSRQVIASIPSFLVFSTILEIPQMSKEDTDKTIGFKAKQHIPLPITAVTLDWIKVGEKTNEDGVKVQQIFLVSVPNEEIEKYKGIFDMAGLKVSAIEMDGFSLARALSVNSEASKLIIDIGSRSTAFLVANDGGLRYSSQSDFAGSSLTHSLSSGLGINMQRAEDLKRQKGLTGLKTAYESELSTLLLPLLDVIINEGKRVKSSYETSYPDKIEEVILTGGGANLLGIERYFSDKMEISVNKANPFSGIAYPGKLEPLVESLGPSLSVVLGLGMKPFI